MRTKQSRQEPSFDDPLLSARFAGSELLSEKLGCLVVGCTVSSTPASSIITTTTTKKFQAQPLEYLKTVPSSVNS